MRKIEVPVITPILIALLFCIDMSVYTCIVLMSALLHECGHLFFIRLFSAEVEKIIILPVGAKIVVKSSMLSYRKDIIISFGGCLSNLLLFLIFYRLYFPVAVANAFFFLLNILPIKGLDGGRILKLILLLRLSPDKAESVFCAISFVFVILLWIVGVYLLMFCSANISLFTLSLFLIIDTVIGQTKSKK